MNSPDKPHPPFTSELIKADLDTAKTNVKMLSDNPEVIVKECKE